MGTTLPSSLGDEDFVEKLKDYVTGSEEMAEIPRDQRYLEKKRKGGQAGGFWS